MQKTLEHYIVNHVTGFPLQIHGETKGHIGGTEIRHSIVSFLESVFTEVEDRGGHKVLNENTGDLFGFTGLLSFRNRFTINAVKGRNLMVRRPANGTAKSFGIFDLGNQVEFAFVRNQVVTAPEIKTAYILELQGNINIVWLAAVSLEL